MKLPSIPGPWKIGILVAVLALGALAVTLFFNGFFSGQDKRVAEGRQAGATEAVAAGQAQTLEQTGDANNAKTDLRAGGQRSEPRYCDCLLDSREPASCERFRPLDVEPVCD